MRPPALLTVLGLAAVIATLAIPAWLTLRPPTAAGYPSTVLYEPEVALDGGVSSGRVLTEPVRGAPDDLSEVGISIYTYFHHARSAARLRLLDGDVALVDKTLTAQQPAGPLEQDLRFDFPPIADASHRALTVELSAPNATSADGFTVFLVQADGDSMRLLDDGRQLAYVLPLRLRAGTPQPVVAQLARAVERASQYRPEAAKDAALVVVAALSFVFALVLAGYVGLSPE